ncbi:hypothetical protein EOD39_18295 [Acipenser ruthenus]|uniref:Uncharacterized protein n=1 Tax=Acipenser ruthenus TaxID=7906 RepID=A0A444V150_ACIRT|nr:hypothetical protein EOD39_18295 [Acipenser ruthenus]
MFELSAVEHDWTECKKAICLVQSLKGAASESLLDLSSEERIEYGALLAPLKQQFGNCEQYLTLQDQLQRRKTAPREKLGALAADIARLRRQAYSDEPNSFSRRTTLNTFLRSLQPASLCH